MTVQLPDEERYALQTQMRRAAVSVPANVVEGCTRQSARDYCRFLEIAQGSASELCYLLTLSIELGLLTSGEATVLADDADHVARALNRLREAAGRFRE